MFIANLTSKMLWKRVIPPNISSVVMTPCTSIYIEAPRWNDKTCWNFRMPWSMVKTAWKKSAKAECNTMNVFFPHCPTEWYSWNFKHFLSNSGGKSCVFFNHPPCSWTCPWGQAVTEVNLWYVLDVPSGLVVLCRVWWRCRCVVWGFRLRIPLP